MATIKAIEAKSVHQIQSGQVIVDLCSVVKELVENSLDAGASAVEIRFKNHGLDSIEVQDNGSGIAPANYETLALKHYTSKLSSFDDLSSLQTFGFRGEALSSLCALSKFSVVTAQADEAPKGKRLDFDSLGKLKSVTVIAAQKGTIASVENLFESLPVRRKELTKNIKREYGKVLGLLQAYACIGINVKFTVKNAMPKGKSMTAFSTKGNATTRENVANVYGAKTLSALAALDLELDYQPTLTQMTRKEKHTNIRVKGHISKPVFGEGRQTPDRQMFFVNGRPCGLPQIAKAINEVYKAFNVSQSPFIFADLHMDTNAYDVNVSPDKRTILIHDSASLVESLKTALNEMFDQQDQTVPQSQLAKSKLPAFQKLSFLRQTSSGSPETESRQTSFSEPVHLVDDQDEDGSEEEQPQKTSLKDDVQKFSRTMEKAGPSGKLQSITANRPERSTEGEVEEMSRQETAAEGVDEEDNVQAMFATRAQSPQSEDEEEPSQFDPVRIHVSDFNAKMAEAQPRLREQSAMHQDAVQQTPRTEAVVQSRTSEEKGLVQNAFDRMRPKRMPAEVATVTIGDRTITTILGSQFPKPQEKRDTPGSLSSASNTQQRTKSPGTVQFSQQLRRFGAQEPDTLDEEEGDADEQAEPEDVDSSSEESEGSPAEHESDSDEPSPRDDEDVAEDEGDTAPEMDGESDTDYIDDEEKKRIEEAKVAELILAAEASSALPTKENLKRATKALAGGRPKESTTNLLATVELSVPTVCRHLRDYVGLAEANTKHRSWPADGSDDGTAQDPEARLSLTVSKPDFARMKIVGQFNLGFVLAVRPAKVGSDDKAQTTQDELFIIDQHASDEKYNFERLQAETVVGNQRLVRPVTLDLTAVEEEVVLENTQALEKNGFLVEVDTSGERMVGHRCRLVSLPLSKEVVFGMKDLEELIQLLAETPGRGDSDIPRPSKVRKMFAMRACRSSIMIGKTLSQRQMERVVANMGTIDKPWNCPHGRPTMRHLCSLDSLQPWREGEDDGHEDAVSLGVALHRFAAEE